MATNSLWYDNGTIRHADEWPSLAFTILPSLTAFSLGAIAIFIALSRGLFLAAIQEGGEKSFFLRVVSAFFHFVLVQISALFASVFYLAYTNNVTSAIAYFLFSYSIFAGLAAAAILVDVAEIKNEADPLDDEDV
ncbi:hypothetical protein MACH21_25230 [Roseicyclus marinus]|uniref:Uncharacterized protein n=1 Tax=Roseicyclus marinus TaxID=2161673 RepID=A0AA48HLA8_9RHOB|nr:hypothetical protein MACH21_25230 [Roseicyclus marinus]